MSLEQQAVEEEAEDEQGVANYQPLAPDDGKMTLYHRSNFNHS